MKEVKKDLLNVKIYDTRPEMGSSAADEAAGYLRELLARKAEVNIVFAAAPSQNEFLEALKGEKIEWERVNAFHMDEYIGLGENAPQRFGNYLKRHIFEHLPLKSVHYLFEEGAAPEKICADYAMKLRDYPVDVIFMGIGENGHIAFNDPHVAFFDDPEDVKIVTLDAKCRNQQVNDGCFGSLTEVPTQAITLTIPTMMRAERLFCIVPASSKADAIAATVNGEITEACPASILRRHKAVTLYCDLDSAKYIK